MATHSKYIQDQRLWHPNKIGSVITVTNTHKAYTWFNNNNNKLYTVYDSITFILTVRSTSIHAAYVHCACIVWLLPVLLIIEHFQYDVLLLLLID